MHFINTRKNIIIRRAMRHFRWLIDTKRSASATWLKMNRANSKDLSTTSATRPIGISAARWFVIVILPLALLLLFRSNQDRNSRPREGCVPMFVEVSSEHIKVDMKFAMRPFPYHYDTTLSINTRGVRETNFDEMSTVQTKIWYHLGYNVAFKTFVPFHRGSNLIEPNFDRIFVERFVSVQSISLKLNNSRATLRNDSVRIHRSTRRG